MRASDADRQQAADLLSQHQSAGRLSLDEYDQRLATVYAAVYLADITPVFADLPGGAPRFRARSEGPESTGAGARPAGMEFDGFGAAARESMEWAREAIGSARQSMGSAREAVRRSPGRPHPLLLALAVLGGLLLAGALVHVLLHIVVPVLVIVGIVMLVRRRRLSVR
jgi:hypothetical protein